uniref:Uncharacterized protein n=1 Tax=Anopheles atroparvus TaxID=41427 RepID=A0AAG5DX18_ANOAO
MAPVRWRSGLLLLPAMLLVLTSRPAVGGDVPSVQPRTDPADSQRRLTDGSNPATPGRTSAASTSTPSGSINATINRCREGCLEKHFVPDLPCSKTRACSTCWSRCSSSDERGGPETTPERCHLQLTVRRMVRNESLVVANVSWGATGSAPKCAGPVDAGSQCLVTWEVSGGGLMGNLLTESSGVQLSLWPDTNYRIQVTCRSKHESVPLVRSAPLTLNTSGATVLERRTSTTTTTTPVTPVSILPWPNEIAEGDDDEALARELDSTDDQQRTPSGKLHAWMVARDSQNTLAILALFVALLLALLALLTIAALVRWRPGAGESPDRIEKDVLVENELSVHGRCGS